MLRIQSASSYWLLIFAIIRERKREREREREKGRGEGQWNKTCKSFYTNFCVEIEIRRWEGTCDDGCAFCKKRRKQNVIFYFFDVACENGISCENADIIISFNWIELSSMLRHTKEFYNTNTLWGLLYGGFFVNNLLLFGRNLLSIPILRRNLLWSKFGHNYKCIIYRCSKFYAIGPSLQMGIVEQYFFHRMCQTIQTFKACKNFERRSAAAT